MTQGRVIAIAVGALLSSVANAQTPKLSKEEKDVERFKAGCLGTAEWANKLGVKPDDGEACAKLARALQQGKGIEKSADLAEDYGRKACDKGAADGCLLVGQIRGEAFLARSKAGDAKAMAESLTKGCDLGSGEACYLIAFWGYQHGHGVPKDKEQEHAHYKRACEAGHAEGCREAGILHDDRAREVITGGKPETDPEVQKENAAALPFYEKACELKSADGCFRAARAYKFGEGAPKDPKKKALFAAKACKLGEKNACGSW